MKIRKPNRSASCTTALKKREHPPSPGSPRSAERSATNNTKGKTVLQLPGRENDQQKKKYAAPKGILRSGAVIHHTRRVRQVNPQQILACIPERREFDKTLTASPSPSST